MAKNKSAGTPHYELLYIISNKFSENELEPIVSKIAQLIAEGEGKITYDEDWGKRRLAYPIKTFTHGYYRLVEFDLTAVNLSRIERNLRMMPELIRHQIIKKETKHANQPSAVLKEQQQPQPVVEMTTAKPIKAEVVKPKSKAKEKADLKELDEKLEKILENTDII
jgi:small subunit ribosomal protein S6